MMIVMEAKSRLIPLKKLQAGDLFECGDACFMVLDKLNSHSAIEDIGGIENAIPIVCLSDATLTVLEPAATVAFVGKATIVGEKRAFGKVKLEDWNADQG